MKKVFAILHEPASYTVDRNQAVYDKMGVDYCYIKSSSLAKSNVAGNESSALSDLSFIGLFKRIREILKTYDIVIVNGYNGIVFQLLFFINLFYGRVIGIDSDTQLSIPASLPKRLIKKIYLNFVFRNKNVYGLPGGTKTHKDLFRYFGMPENRIFLMPMMIDNSKYNDTMFRIKSLSPFKFLFVGRLIECKNLNLMIDAFIDFNNEYPYSELHIVGNGELENSIKLSYKKHPAVKFLGALYGDQLSLYYRNCHVLILASTSEQWGLVVNEAMAGGLPTIVSDKVGARYDLVEDGVTGFVFHSTDKKELTECMKKVSSSDKYSYYSENAYNLMHTYWNYDLYRKCLEKFIKSV